MKKILTMATIGIGIFIVLVGVIFFVLSTLNSTTPEPAPEAQESKYAESRSVASLLLEVREKELDSLKNQISVWKNDIFLRDTKVDSLNDVIARQKKATANLQQQIAVLNTKLNANLAQGANVKDLAKTFETMKANEIAPILNKVDDPTVIAIYRNMGSRSKKMIMTALSSDRAAEITKQLAGIQTEG